MESSCKKRGQADDSSGFLPSSVGNTETPAKRRRLKQPDSPSPPGGVHSDMTVHIHDTKNLERWMKRKARRQDWLLVLQLGLSLLELELALGRR